MPVAHPSELPAAAFALLPEVSSVSAQENPILVIPKNRGSVRCDTSGGHYFAGGLPALMQAVRLLQNVPAATVTYVNDGELKKSTQSAHQGHVHPTEWTTPELGTIPLIKLLLKLLVAGII